MITILNHPLIAHKIAILRNIKTSSEQFRATVEEVALLMAYQAFSDLKTNDVVIQSPLETITQKMIDESSIVIVPILRAGLGMISGILKLVPCAKVGHIGMYRDHSTLQPREYYCKLPLDIDKKISILLDPMLATGGSCISAINYLKQYGAKQIKILSIIAAPEGVKKVEEKYPDVHIYISSMDRCLNVDGYILPGLGDAGDRIFGTK